MSLSYWPLGTITVRGSQLPERNPPLFSAKTRTAIRPAATRISSHLLERREALLPEDSERLRLLYGSINSIVGLILMNRYPE